MANEKQIFGRLIQKHDTEANWLKAENFIPKQGEIIVYDVDDKYDYERFKIGDGKKTITQLSFYMIDQLDAKLEAIMAELSKKAEISIEDSTLIIK